MIKLVNEQTLRPGMFRLPDDPFPSEILIPAFRASKRVRGAFGWFTAGWIERLAPGLAEYLNREETEPIDFTVAPMLYSEERAAVEEGVQITAQEAADRVANVFIGGHVDASALGRHALKCLTWMIATKALRLRIAVPTPDSNYHPKIWFFDDGVNQVLARGSGNATGRGVAAGVEHFDVDVSWLPESQSRVTTGIAMLDDWSRGASLGLEEVIELPAALTRDIIRTAPQKPPSPTDYVTAAHASNGLWQPRQNIERRLRIPTDLEWKTGKYDHQGKAVKCWEEGDAPETGVIAMATGAGKTFTALICATRCQDKLDGGPFLVIISAPSRPLIMQWCKQVKEFGVTPVAPSLTRNTDKALTHFFRALQGGGTHVAIVTNNLLCKPSFQSTVSEKIQKQGKVIPTMLIADEAHTLGTDSFINNKPDFFTKRLALSATPERQYDPDGTEKIFEFFGSPVYQFGLDRAIGFCLVPYKYYVHACTLNSDELDKFEQLSRQIAVARGSGNTDEDSCLQRLLIARRRIIETGHNKVELLREVLTQRGPRDLEHALIYVSAKNPEQFEAIASLLTDLGVKWASVTEKTTKNPGQLARILTSFKKGTHQVLLAKKVLDEGIDIPNIREAFIVASSTVEREWIQRRGRVLRTHPDKPWAMIHDFLALPPVDLAKRDEAKSLRNIIQTELERAYTFGKHAGNVAGNDGIHADLNRISTAYWSNGSSQSGILSTADQYVIASAIPSGKPW